MPNLFDVSVVCEDFWSILLYLPVTLKLSVFAMILGLAIGFVLAIIRIKRIPLLQRFVTLFISMIRGTPILVQLYVTYFGIPIFLKYYSYWTGKEVMIGNVPSIIYAIVALSLNQSALHAVTIQSALQAVNKGEIEAATSLGLTPFQRMSRIIIPEALELAIPSLGNTLIGLVKGTSLAFSCAIVEMTAQGKIVASRNYRYFEAYVALAVIYWLITIFLEFVIARVLHAVRVPDAPKQEKAETGIRELIRSALYAGRKKCTAVSVARAGL